MFFDQRRYDIWDDGVFVTGLAACQNDRCQSGSQPVSQSASLSMVQVLRGDVGTATWDKAPPC